MTGFYLVTQPQGIVFFTWRQDPLGFWSQHSLGCSIHKNCCTFTASFVWSLHHSTISDRAMPRNESMDGLDTLLAEVRLAAAAQQQQLAIHLYYQQILGKTSTVLGSCKSLSSLHWRNEIHLGYLVCLTLLRIHHGILVRLWGEDEKRMIKLNLITTARELEL